MKSANSARGGGYFSVIGGTPSLREQPYADNGRTLPVRSNFTTLPVLLDLLERSTCHNPDRRISRSTIYENKIWIKNSKMPK